MATFELLQALQNEVGSRRVGTAGEQRAQAWLQARCQGLGLTVELDPFPCVDVWRHLLARPLILLTWLLLCQGVRTFNEPLGTAGSLLGAVLILLTYLPPLDQRLEAKWVQSTSYNIIAGLSRPFSEYAADPAQGPAFLVSAHYDTAQTHPAWFQRMRAWIPSWMVLALLPLAWIALRILLLLIWASSSGALGLTRSLAQRLGREPLADRLGKLGTWLTQTGERLYTLVADLDPWMNGLALILYAPALFLTAFYLLSRWLRPQTDSPGADDNGSGTALVLELAQRLQAAPPVNIEVFFVWWGAEEQGLRGSHHFVRRFGPQLDKNKLYLINADCVGVGPVLMVSAGLGLVRRRRTDPAMLERIERSASRLGIETARVWLSLISGVSSDHTEWMKAGFTRVAWFLRDEQRQPPALFRLATRLLRLPDTRLPALQHAHSPHDTLARIDPQALEKASDLAEACIRETDAAQVRPEP